MGRPIIHHDGWFIEWTTISDGPLTLGMRRAEFEGYYRDEYGRNGAADLSSRLDRAVANGTSEHGATDIHDTISCNRAGYAESYLPLAEIIRIYCVEQRNPVAGEGTVLANEDEEVSAAAGRAG